MKARVLKILLPVLAIVGLVGVPFALAAPDKITALGSALYWGAISDGQVIIRSTNKIQGTDNIRNLRVAALSYSTPTPVALDFNPTLPMTKTFAITTPMSFTFSNLAAGRVIEVLLTADGSSRSFDLPSGTVYFAATPTALAASKHAKLTLTSTSTAASGVRAEYSVEP